MTLTQLEELGVGLNVGIAWEEALHSALMPITPQASMGSLAESESSTSQSIPKYMHYIKDFVVTQAI